MPITGGKRFSRFSCSLDRPGSYEEKPRKAADWLQKTPPPPPTPEAATSKHTLVASKSKTSRIGQTSVCALRSIRACGAISLCRPQVRVARYWRKVLALLLQALHDDSLRCGREQSPLIIVANSGSSGKINA